MSIIDWDIEPDLERLRRARATQRVDPRQGLQDLVDLAELGSVAGMIYVGHAYQTGEGCPKDAERAEYWFRSATETGSLEGSFRLAGLYRASGRFDEALQLYTISAALNFPAAITWIGRMYSDGLGVEPDLDKAIELWRRASVLGHPYATRNLAMLYIKGRYGLAGVFKGVGMLLSAIRDAVSISIQDPKSNLLW